MEGNSWDPNVFHADRYGEMQDTVPTFHIDYAPGITNYPHSGAPSRPPSRTSHHSASNTGDAPLPSIETTIGQESGVIGGGAGSTYFGPATKDQYDDNQWAIVRTTNSEMVPDPSPTERKRDPEGPAIIKPLLSQDYLPSLLPILHSIPLARNALLSPEVHLNHYGSNPEWWKGTAIQIGRAAITSSETDFQDIELIYECQRLMALLDMTERAYGSVESLLNHDAFKKTVQGLNLNNMPDFHKFLMVLGNAYKNHCSSNGMDGILRSRVNAGEMVESYFLDATVIHRKNEHPTIYDVLDEHLFEAGGSTPAFVVEISNVLVLKLSRSDRNSNGLDVQIPGTFYAGRYMEKNAAKVKQVYQEINKYKFEMGELEQEDRKIRYHKMKKTGNEVEGLKLLQAAMKGFEPFGDGLQHPDNAITLAKLKMAYEAVESKLHDFDEKKKKLEETLERIKTSFRFGTNDDLSDISMDTADDSSSTTAEVEKTEVFQLRGVTTKPNVLYVLHPDVNSDVPGAMQWWRTEYLTFGDSGDQCAIARERMSLDQVLDRASSENTEALLVYANANALNAENIPLTKALSDFVKKDNVAFMEELQSAGIGGGAGTPIIGEFWDQDKFVPPMYENAYGNDSTDAFGSMSASQFNQAQRQNGSRGNDGNIVTNNDRFDMQGSAFSSATLTPNTEMEEYDGTTVGRDVEMREVTGGNAFFSSMTNRSGLAGGAEGVHSLGGMMRDEDEVVDVVLSPPDSEMEGVIEEGSPRGTLKRGREEERKGG